MLESRFGAHDAAPLKILLISKELLGREEACFLQQVPTATVLHWSRAGSRGEKDYKEFREASARRSCICVILSTNGADDQV